MRLLGKIALTFVEWLADVAASVLVFCFFFGAVLPFTALPFWLSFGADAGLAYMALWFLAVAIGGAISGVCNVISKG